MKRQISDGVVELIFWNIVVLNIGAVDRKIKSIQVVKQISIRARKMKKMMR